MGNSPAIGSQCVVSSPAYVPRRGFHSGGPPPGMYAYGGPGRMTHRNHGFPGHVPTGDVPHRPTGGLEFGRPFETMRSKRDSPFGFLSSNRAQEKKSSTTRTVPKAKGDDDSNRKSSKGKHVDCNNNITTDSIHTQQAIQNADKDKYTGSNPTSVGTADAKDDGMTQNQAYEAFAEGWSKLMPEIAQSGDKNVEKTNRNPTDSLGRAELSAPFESFTSANSSGNLGKDDLSGSGLDSGPHNSDRGIHTRPEPEDHPPTQDYKKGEDRDIEVKRDFLRLLSEHPEIDRQSGWSEVKKWLCGDPRYKSVDSRATREDWFREYQKALRNKHKRVKQKARNHRPGGRTDNSDKDTKGTKTENKMKDGLDDLPSAKSDFIKLVQKPFFVDKTGMIKDFVEDEHDGLVISAPRRFGKTTNLDMLKRFFEIVVNSKGRIVKAEETPNYQAFTHRVNDEKPLQVFNDTDFFHKYFGKLPVLHLDFHGLSGTSYQRLINGFKVLVSDAFSDREYILNIGKMSEHGKKQFIKYMKGQFANDDEVFRGIHYLTKVMSEHFRKRVLVLIDEVDAPLQSALLTCDDIKPLSDYIGSFLAYLLKSNPYVSKFLINDCSRLSTALSWQLNNAIYLTFLGQHVFNKYYGLTQTEVTELLQRNGLSHEERAVKEWYEGYKTQDEGTTIYNTWSITRYLQYKQITSYWVECEFFQQLKTFFEDDVYYELLSLVDGETVDIQYVDRFFDDDLKNLRNIMRQTIISDEPYDPSSYEVDLCLQFIGHIGYFQMFKASVGKATIKIPNHEVEMLFRKIVYDTHRMKKL